MNLLKNEHFKDEFKQLCKLKGIFVAYYDGVAMCYNFFREEKIGHGVTEEFLFSSQQDIHEIIETINKRIDLRIEKMVHEQHNKEHLYAPILTFETKAIKNINIHVTTAIKEDKPILLVHPTTYRDLLKDDLVVHGRIKKIFNWRKRYSKTRKKK